MDEPRPKAPLVLDARYTHTGRYSAWLQKTKSDGSKAKWLNSKCSRFFTIDFDTHLFRYSSSDINKDLSVKIRFHEINRAELVRSKDSSEGESTPTGGLRRSFSSLLQKGQRPSAETSFKLYYGSKVVELTAETHADALTWVDMLNSAAHMGQEQATSAGASVGSSCHSGQTTPSADAWGDGSTNQGSSDTDNSRPPSSASTSLPPLEAVVAGTNRHADDCTDEDAIDIEVVDSPRNGNCQARLSEQTTATEQLLLLEQEQEGELMQQQQLMQQEHCCQQQQQQQQQLHEDKEEAALLLQSEGTLRKLQAADFGFDDEASEKDAESSEGEEALSPVVTPRLVASPPLDAQLAGDDLDDGSDSDREASQIKRNERMASDLKLVARRLADAEEGSRRKSDSSEKKRAKAKRKQQERESRIAADLLLAQSVRGGGHW